MPGWSVDLSTNEITWSASADVAVLYDTIYCLKIILLFAITSHGWCSISTSVRNPYRKLQPNQEPLLTLCSNLPRNLTWNGITYRSMQPDMTEWLGRLQRKDQRGFWLGRNLWCGSNLPVYALPDSARIIWLLRSQRSKHVNYRQWSLQSTLWWTNYATSSVSISACSNTSANFSYQLIYWSCSSTAIVSLLIWDLRWELSLSSHLVCNDLPINLYLKIY